MMNQILSIEFDGKVVQISDEGVFVVFYNYNQPAFMIRYELNQFTTLPRVGDSLQMKMDLSPQN